MILVCRIALESMEGLRLRVNVLGEFEMGKWNGIMMCGFSGIPVTVTFDSPSDGLEVWYGNSVTNKDWAKNQRQFETNIGAVLIVNKAIHSDGRHHIEFRGSGNPKGPLAQAMSALNEVLKMDRRISGGRVSPSINPKSNPT
jgi:hypothetical protein